MAGAALPAAITHTGRSLAGLRRSATLAQVPGIDRADTGLRDVQDVSSE